MGTPSGPENRRSLTTLVGSTPTPSSTFEPVAQGMRARLCGGRGRWFNSSRVHQHFQAEVAQWQEALVLETKQCGFESLLRHQTFQAVVAQVADAHGREPCW